ncbi:polymer-forming cytoskeletal protein [Vogesella sp. XCS3]|uniref:bactofilin family protein n=1 Tax=Vogesella sp. XCS3 TaxID=2877939 RepID=UPI001D0BACD2|nr:polymer-forming cytoskeletal protein [Vogesella sp. XCS3]UDM18841.1 polymer-forming cytoskeletal protein [Vogesella sp. XCS3]
MRKFFAKMLLGADTLGKLQRIQQSEVLEAEAGKAADGSVAEAPKVSTPTITRDQIRSLIEIDMEIHGNVFIGKGVKVSGRVIGSLIPNGGVEDCDPIVLVSPAGHVTGDLHSRVVVVAGHLDGDIYADHVLLMPTAKVNGTVNYRHTLRQDIGSALSGMVRRVDDIPLLDKPPKPAEMSAKVIDAAAEEVVPTLKLEAATQSSDSVVAIPVRTARAASNGAPQDIQRLYEDLNVSAPGAHAVGA